MPVDGGYPQPTVRVTTLAEVETEFSQLPAGLTDDWPPTQWKYLVDYLKEASCHTVVIEHHYIDRDFVDDMALFYARSLRGYRNHCRRLHFFADKFDQSSWNRLIKGRQPKRVASRLQKHYLGFLVQKPLPGTPIGRTVLTTSFRGTSHKPGTRNYDVHLAGLDLTVSAALAFQQQDQGVSACATTALWSALHKTAASEGIRIPTPAAITQSASRYLLPVGRALPSEGLTLSQMSEACRAVDLSPLVVEARDLVAVRGLIHTVIESGFPPVLSIAPLRHRDGHAVCAVGFQRRELQPPATAGSRAQDAGSTVDDLLIHDDRLGPYARAILSTEGSARKRRVVIDIKKRDGGLFDKAVVKAVLVPLPSKIRLSPLRMREVGFLMAQAISARPVTTTSTNMVVSCRYRLAVDYLRNAHSLGLTPTGTYELKCQTALSRYLGIVELASPDAPLLDILMDATETEPNPFVLALVTRGGLTENARRWAKRIAEIFGAKLIS